VKPVTDIAAKYAEVTPGRQAFYQAGIQSPKSDWATNAAAAAINFQAAVTAGDIGKRFAGGIKKAGTQKWQRKALAVGPNRFSEGVRAAQADFAAGIEPFITTIAGLTLPARRPRGDAANLDRVKVIADALTKKRLALRASGG